MRRTPTGRPGLELILGPARSGKTTLVLDEVARSLAAQERVMVLLPTSRTVADFKRRFFDHTGLAALGRPEIFTFRQLAENILRENEPGLRSIPPAAQETILSRIVQDLTDHDRIATLKHVASFPGFVPALRAWVGELKRSEITPEAFAEYARSSTAKDRELAHIYADYQATMHRTEVYDPEGLFWHAKEILADRTVPPVAGLQSLFVDGFYDFTPMELSVLALMARSGVRLTMTLVHEEDQGRAGLFTTSRRTLTGLDSLFRVKSRTVPACADAGSQLQFIERHLFRHPLPAQPGPTSSVVTFLETPGDVVEIEEIARLIKGPLVAEGIAPDDVAVVARSLADYAPLVAEVFARFGIPFHLSGEVQLGSLPVARLAAQLLTLVSGDYPVSQLASVLSSSLVDLGEDTWVARAFRDLAVEAGALRSSDDLDARLADLHSRLSERLESLPDVPGDDGPRYRGEEELQARIQLVQRTRSMLKSFFTMMEPLRRARGFADISDALHNLLDHLHVPQRLRGRPEDPATVLNLRSYDALLDTLEALTRTAELLPAQGDCEPTRFADELLRSMSELSISSGGSRQVGVNVLSVQEARGLSFPVVFVCGLLDHAFPRAHREGPFHDDTDRARMQSAGLPLRPRRTSQDEESFLFYLACTRAGRFLFLTYPVTDREGKPRLVSHYVDEVKRLLGPAATGSVLRVRLTDKVPDLPGVSSLLELRRFLVSDACAHGPAHSGLHQSIMGFLEDQSSTSLLMEGMRAEAERDSFHPFVNFDGVISTPTIVAQLHERFGPDYPFSPSALEDYAACPFRFFCRYVLRLAEPATLEEEISPADEGRIYHDVFWEFFHELRRRDPLRTVLVPARRDEYLNLIRDLAAKRMERFRRSRRHLNRGLWELSVEAVLDTVSGFIDGQLELLSQSPSRRPAFFEVSFGLHRRHGHADELSTPRPMRLEPTDAPGVSIVGKIDRIDVLTAPRAGFVVVDYKTGRAVPVSHIARGLFLQLPLYVIAAERLLLAGKDLEALRAELYVLRGQKSVPRLSRYKDDKPDPKWTELLEATLGFVEEYVTGIRQGEFPALVREDCPTYCEFRGICRYNERRALKKKEGWRPWFHRRKSTETRS